MAQKSNVSPLCLAKKTPDYISNLLKNCSEAERLTLYKNCSRIQDSLIFIVFSVLKDNHGWFTNHSWHEELRDVSHVELYTQSLLIIF